LVILPLIFINYLFYIKMGVPVGFEDIHANIIQYQQVFGEQGNIVFSNSQTISYNFVGIYIIFRFLLQIMNFSLINMAILIPPFFNLIIVLTVYTIANNLHSHRVALITTLLFGWENQIIIFGHEMRTQTIGTLLLFIILSLFMCSQKSINKNLKYRKIALILVIFSIVTTSFISIVYTFIILLTIIITADILPKVFKWPQNSIFITRGIIVLLFIAFISYLIYISNGFGNVTSSLISLINESINIGATLPHSESPVYGTFVMNVNRIFLGTFLIFSAPYTIDIIKRKNLEGVVLFTGFGFLLFFWFFNFIVQPLSPSRIYIVGFLIISIVVSVGLLNLQNLENHSKKWKNNFASKIFAYVIIILFVTSSVVQFPNYLIGETYPIRHEVPIDTIPYWDSDLPQYAASSFLSLSAENQSVCLQMFIENYYLLQNSKKNNIKYEYSTSPIETRLPKQKKLVLLHDKFRGQVYTNRDLLPKSEEYSQFSKIYSNDDYIVYNM
ncbi:MAG TPA: hypothetical protein VFE71_12180, partial [Bacteroidales bacterium]|nr:hypothetical protein [Bacteroidales bacterium]